MLFRHHIAIAVKNSTRQPGDPKTPKPATPLPDSEPPVTPPVLPLNGVKIAVAKKLSAKQADLNNMASDLGADYCWTYG